MLIKLRLDRWIGVNRRNSVLKKSCTHPKTGHWVRWIQQPKACVVEGKPRAWCSWVSAEAGSPKECREMCRASRSLWFNFQVKNYILQRLVAQMTPVRRVDITGHRDRSQCSTGSFSFQFLVLGRTHLYLGLLLEGYFREMIWSQLLSAVRPWVSRTVRGPGVVQVWESRIGKWRSLLWVTRRWCFNASLILLKW